MSGRKSRRRGRDFEYRVAKRLSGQIWTGQDGDVDAKGYRVECKLRTNWQLESTTTLADWFEQIDRYKKANPKTKFALAMTGGGRDVWVAVPIEEFDRLTDLETDIRSIREVFDRNPAQVEQLLSALHSLVYLVKEEQETNG